MIEDDYSDEALGRFAIRNGLPRGSAVRAGFIDDMIHLLDDAIPEERIRVLYEKFLKPATVTEFLRIAQENRKSSAQHKKKKVKPKEETPKTGEKPEPTN